MGSGCPNIITGYEGYEGYELDLARREVCSKQEIKVAMIITTETTAVNPRESTINTNTIYLLVAFL